MQSGSTLWLWAPSAGRGDVFGGLAGWWLDLLGPCAGMVVGFAAWSAVGTHAVAGLWAMGRLGLGGAELWRPRHVA